MNKCDNATKWLIKLGRAKERLKIMLREVEIGHISKHHPFWHHQDPHIAEKLETARLKISYLVNGIEELTEILSEDME